MYRIVVQEKSLAVVENDPALIRVINQVIYICLALGPAHGAALYYIVYVANIVDGADAYPLLAGLLVPLLLVNLHCTVTGLERLVRH